MMLIKRGRLFALAIGAVGLVLLSAGCSDEESSGESAGNEIVVEVGSLTKSQFLKRANAICQETQTNMRNRFFAYLRDAEVTLQNQDAQLDKVMQTIIVPSYEQQIDQIRSLGAPSGDEDEISAFLNAEQKGVEKGEERPAKFIQDSLLLSKATKLAVAYGLDKCIPGNT